ncbi:MAG: hypothetical protein JXQ96_22540 [Cyclobacteriaceae bacterium]
MVRACILSLILLLCLCSLGCKYTKKYDVRKSKQEYIMVDAKVRKYNKDGTRNYLNYKPFKTRTVELLNGYEPSKEALKLSKYGGRTDRRVEATGFFYVKKIDSRWWVIDPQGYYYFNIALNSIKPGGSERNQRVLKAKYDSKENWMKETIFLLQENGFTCAGSWSDAELISEANNKLDNPFTYCVNLNFMSKYGKVRGGTYQLPGHVGYPKNAIFVFDPEFEAFCDQHAQQLEAKKNDPNIFGYFSDNEMPFKINSLENYYSLPEEEPGHKAAVKWMKDRGIKLENITDQHRQEFLSLVAEKYFSIVSKSIKKYDPNHMYIGARFYSSEKNQPAFMKTVGKYLDIVSNNYYGKWTPDQTDMDNWANWTGKPFIITEYYTKGEDSGMGNTSGAGWIVRTQRDRGLFYQNYNLALIESKNCVGWHYFKYQDNDPTAKGVDPSNVDSNKGIVNNDYEVWKPMIVKMNELNNQVYQIIDYFDSK